MIHIDNVNSLPKAIDIIEVGPRDGLQNEQAVSTKSKIQLVDALSLSGLLHIETGAFVSPKYVPQMADSIDVFNGIKRSDHVVYSALTPNRKGLEAAIEANADSVAIFASASEGFSQRNINCSISESLNRFSDVIEVAEQYGIPVRGYISCVTDCPYDGKTDPKTVASLAKTLLDMGCYEVSLGDTIGTGTPNTIANMLDSVLGSVDPLSISAHFHDTYGQALANLYQALCMGVTKVDSSVAGLGGCPYARGASGNVATEDVLYMCKGLGIETGIDLKAVAQAGWEICKQLNKQPSSKVSWALYQQAHY
ncbi:hydroxymethylglutaryl-CoA lyase [Vibrio caribbeanicus]|uniref:hydroxymethylglutaryl-CoA lyase n=1 Tax=Vibrio caribbeanicus ATCC BAA-2122 TaxID=796620 RepID=E3BMF8_9VIBR|nr:hydroxymethylglutaryl-CoA lyase [Vibrio caribbeanicus]EFP95703.1 hydroxymethylglutaryl-CoA lyase [Vibrio caribbeanicus ATCC BAA-2122]